MIGQDHAMADDNPDRPHPHPPATPRSHHAQRSSYETGESSWAGSLREQTPSTDRSRNETLNHEGSPGEGRAKRRNKHRSAGGFLLQDAGATDGVRNRARSLLVPKGKNVPRTPESHGHNSGSHGHSSESHAPSSGSRSHEHSSASKESSGPSAVTDSPPADHTARDDDASQIVNMALNLSESRRNASRRHVSRTNPPRLAPLPDAAPRNNLGRELQQQRKASRTGSPRPGHNASPRIPSGSFRANSPLQAEPESNYRYHFSASTLARAQKAKEHLELMAEYRRVLESLPSLKPGEETPGSPTATSKRSRGNEGQPGRPYNPLQYVRNRKVRARERKVIDGEKMGFGDVDLVRSWVDRLQEWNTAGVQANHFTMPHFAGAEDNEAQPSTENGLKQATRARRPRVDWFFDPCDMVADAYWLEQDNHKQLIENRHWRKIFPSAAPLNRPMSRQADEVGIGITPLSTNTDEPDLAPVLTEDSDGRRERAKQKLHDMKPFQHRQSSSMHSHHDLFGKRRDSLSDMSGSEDGAKDTVRRRRDGRRGTITSDTNELLQKQMMDIVAQEARDKELANVPETEAEHQHHPEPPQPERVPTTASQPHSRKTSVADFSDVDTRISHKRLDSPARYRSGRPSLEIPKDSRRGSVTDIYQSMPSSPRFEESKELSSPGGVGVDLSTAPSRTGSPTRNPLAKVRRKLRDRKEAGWESQSDIEEDTRPPPGPIQDPPSPSEKLTHRPTDESWKSHRSTQSLGIRREEQSGGLRGLFKGGPRIDTVLRSGVSKLGDIIWKKDEEHASEGETTEESDAENRGRSRQSLTLSRRESRRLRDDAQKPEAKHFFDSMPQFHPVNESPSQRPSVAHSHQLSVNDLSRPVSRQSTRWEQLKPPRIDISNASPTISPQKPESDVSDSERSVFEAVKEAGRNLNNAIIAPSLDPRNRSSSRHWSITDRTPSPARAQLSKREIARMRALILASGIKAMEITRRAHTLHKPLCSSSLEEPKQNPRHNVGGMAWSDIASLTSSDKELHEQQIPVCDAYPLASRTLGLSIQSSSQTWQSLADNFTSTTAPSLQKRIWTVRSRITDDLSQMTRRAADEADETSKELALDQPLKVKHVVDVIEKLIRTRRRRFRWVRRGLWLAVEWALVGFMWWVWLMVMIFRLFWGVGRGVVGGIRWLLWL